MAADICLCLAVAFIAWLMALAIYLGLGWLLAKRKPTPDKPEDDPFADWDDMGGEGGGGR